MKFFLFMLLIFTQGFSQLLDVNDNHKQVYQKNKNNADYELYNKEVLKKTGKTIRQLIYQNKDKDFFQTSFSGYILDAVQACSVDFCKSNNDCHNIQKYLFSLLRIDQSTLYIGITPNIDDYPEFLERQGGG